MAQRGKKLEKSRLARTDRFVTGTNSRKGSVLGNLESQRNARLWGLMKQCLVGMYGFEMLSKSDFINVITMRNEVTGSISICCSWDRISSSFKITLYLGHLQTIRLACLVDGQINPLIHWNIYYHFQRN